MIDSIMNMKKPILILLITMQVYGCNVSSVYYLSDNQVKIIRYLHSLPSWEAVFEYPVEFHKFFMAAYLLKSVNDDERREILANFVRIAPDYPPNRFFERRFYILLRVMFELPNRISQNEARPFHNWIYTGNIRNKKWFSITWPVIIGANKSKLIIKHPTFRESYDGMMEYDFMVDRYKFRSRKELRIHQYSILKQIKYPEGQMQFFRKQKGGEKR